MATRLIQPSKLCWLDATSTARHRSDPDLNMYVRSTSVRHMLVQFDVSALSVSTLTSARLRLKVIQATSAVGREHRINRLTRTDWTTTLLSEDPATSGATWSHANYSTLPWSIAGGDYTATGLVTYTVPAVGTFVDVTVTSLVTDAINSRGNQLSLIVRDQGGGATATAEFGGLYTGDAPVLVAEYTDTSPVVSLVGVGNLAKAANAGVTPPLPVETLQQNDLLVCFNVTTGSAQPGTPAGWSVAVDDLNSGNRIRLLWRRYQAGDVAPTLTFAPPSAFDVNLAQIAALRNVVTSGDPTHVLGSVFADTGNVLNIGPVSGLTTTVAGCAVIVVGSKNNDSNYATLTGDSLTWQELGDHKDSALGDDISLVWDLAVAATAKTVSAKTFTPNTGTASTGETHGVMWAIRPAVEAHSGGSTALVTVAATGGGSAGSVRASAKIETYLSYTAATQGKAAYSAYHEHIDEVLPSWWRPDDSADGSVVLQESGVTVEDTAFVSEVISNGDRVWGVLANYHGGGTWTWTTVHTILTSASLRTAHVNALVQLAVNKNYVGIDVDYENGTDATDRDLFTSFCTELATALHGAGKLLSITLQPKEYEPGNQARHHIQNWAALGAVADEIHVMLYDYDPEAGPASQSPYPWWGRVAAFAAAQFPVSKLLLGAPTYGYHWSGSTLVEDLEYADCEALRVSKSATRQYHATDRSPYFTYVDGAVTHTVYYEDSESLTERATFARQRGCRGLFFWRLGGEDTALWQPVAEAIQPRKETVTAALPTTKACWVDAADTDKHQSLPSGALYVKSSLARHTLLEFNLDAVPAGATLNSATLSLRLGSTTGDSPVGRTYTVNRMTRTDWVTTRTNTNPATTGATWSHYDYPASAWTTAGGDYTTTGAVTFTVPAVGTSTSTSVTALAADAIASRGGVLSLVIRDGGASSNATSLFDGPSTANPPTLTVSYTMPAAGGAQAVVTVTATAGGRSGRRGGAIASVSAAASGAGRSGRRGGATASVSAAASGAGRRPVDGGAQTSVTVTATGTGRAGRRGGVTATVTAAATAGGRTGRRGGATATVNVTAPGAGRASRAGGASAALLVTVQASGKAARRGGAAAAATVTATGAGRIGRSGGAATSVAVTAFGAGRRGASGGAQVSVSVLPSGVGSATRAGGGAVSVAVSAFGAGAAGYASGSSTAVSVTASGAAGAAGHVGGAVATVAASASGGGAAGFAGAALAAVAVDALAAGLTQRAGGASASLTAAASGAGVSQRLGGSGAALTVSAAGTGNPGHRDGTLATVSCVAAGAGSPGHAGGVVTPVAVTASGAGVGGRAGGALATLAVAAAGGGVAARAGSSAAPVTAAASGAGVKSASGAAAALVTVTATGGGAAEGSGGSTVTVTVTATGTASPARLGGAAAVVRVGPASGGVRGAAGGVTALVPVSATSAGVTHRAGGATAAVTAVASGAGGVAPEGGATATVTAAVSGAGFPARTGGALGAVTAAASGAGSAAHSGGAAPAVTVSAVGAGQVGRHGGATAAVTTAVTGAGQAGRTGYSYAALTVTATGAGSSARTGATTATVTVSVVGVGAGGASGGMTATVTVTATGGGAKLVRDITITWSAAYRHPRTGQATTAQRVSVTQRRALAPAVTRAARTGGAQRRTLVKEAQ